MENFCKYMAFYSFVQFISVVIIYWRSSIPSDTEYLYVDLLIIDVIALTATRNEGRIGSHFKNSFMRPRSRFTTWKRLQIRFQAYDKISPNAPPPRVIHLPTILSMTLQISIVTAFQIGVYFWTINQEWFCSVSDNFPDCFIRDESGEIVRAKKGF